MSLPFQCLKLYYKLNRITGLKRPRRGTSFMIVTTEAMARRKEKQQRYKKDGVSGELNEIAHFGDTSTKNLSATNLTTLSRNASSPCHRQGLNGRYVHRLGSTSPPKPLLRRCQSSRPAKLSKSSRIEALENTRWRQNQDNVRKHSSHKVFTLGCSDENSKLEADYLQIERGLTYNNKLSSDKLSNSISTIQLEKNEIPKSTPDQKEPKIRSHSVVVFVEDALNTETTLLHESFHSKPLSKHYRSLERVEKQTELDSSNMSKHGQILSSSIIKRTAFCKKDAFCNKTKNSLQDEIKTSDEKIDSSSSDPSHFMKLEEEIRLKDNSDDSIQYQANLTLLSKPSKTSLGNDKNITNTQNEAIEEENSEIHSSDDLHTFLGGSIESNI